MTFRSRDHVTDLVIRFCPMGHEVVMSHYVWTLFLFHRCKGCRRLYNFNELTKEKA